MNRKKDKEFTQYESGWCLGIVNRDDGRYEEGSGRLVESRLMKMRKKSRVELEMKEILPGWLVGEVVRFVRRCICESIRQYVEEKYSESFLCYNFKTKTSSDVRVVNRVPDGSCSLVIYK